MRSQYGVLWAALTCPVMWDKTYSALQHGPCVSLGMGGIGHMARVDIDFSLQLEGWTVGHTEAQINWGGLRYQTCRFSDQAGPSKGLEVFF